MRATLLALALLAACSAPEQRISPTEPGSAAIHLSGTSWRRMDDTNANPHGATLEFADNRASGYTGCNRWFASVTQQGEELRFGQAGMTRMACGELQTDIERSFLAVIEATRYAHYDQDALVLLDANQQVIAEFRVE